MYSNNNKTLAPKNQKITNTIKLMINTLSFVLITGSLYKTLSAYLNITLSNIIIAIKNR